MPLELDPNDAQIWTNRGAVRVALGEFKEAIADFDRALELNPKDAIAWQYRGVARQAQSEKRARADMPPPAHPREP
jgi:tetratricopeptide (TPR) repeat protein